EAEPFPLESGAVEGAGVALAFGSGGGEAGGELLLALLLDRGHAARDGGMAGAKRVQNEAGLGLFGDAQRFLGLVRFHVQRHQPMKKTDLVAKVLLSFLLAAGKLLAQRIDDADALGVCGAGLLALSGAKVGVPGYSQRRPE